MKTFNVNYHVSVCIDNNIYVDPLNIKGEPHNAAVVLITHSHGDHLSVADIKKVMNEKTFFVAPKDCLDKLAGEGFRIDKKNSMTVDGKDFDAKYHDGKDLGIWIPNTNLRVLAFPAYNKSKPFHPKANGWVGYILSIDNERFVVCGDTDCTPELGRIKCDVLFIPISGKFVMTPEEAAACANTIKPKIAVPTHYMFNDGSGNILGDKDGERIFIDNLDKKIKCKVFL